MQRATDKILISLKRSNSNSIVSKSPRNRIVSRPWREIRSGRSGGTCTNTRRKFLFLSANRQPGKKWKKRKRLGFCSSLATRKNLIMCASAVKSHNGRREHRACLGRREALVTPSPGEILFPAGDSVVFSEQRPPSAISSFSFSLSSRGKFHLWSTELRREQRRRTNGES